ncbi:Rne/Rng family ribonuclease [Desulfatitalea alkaliphila]|uniref:Rne/Rng family ribonuclease n=1 Tax=Desulfatitalea alkaliphila TaxID=2929485 RepID=A0AA41R4F6_9BACT|nr:Rne/Rng family ribonuclease [Desulfatitalea alkaliphila]MCJ8500890.1 Rne/Rng family ribonuclease [Desulfatitalea alkaliphila]
MANKKIIINDMPHETRVALMEEGNIVELFIERRGASDSSGNIYKGRVQRVLPGMQAAFVDIGLAQAAFLYVNDIVPHGHEPMEVRFADNGESEYPDDHNATAATKPAAKAPEKSHPRIAELISEGQELLAQVSKSPMGTKGARITNYISLPGRFLVLMPTSNHIGVSRRIEDENERSRLREMVLELRTDSLGYIVRTAAEGVGPDKILQEMAFLKKLWDGIQRKYEDAPAPSMVHQELDVSLRAVRDLLVHEAEKLIIDSRRGCQEICAFLDTFIPNLKETVELYEGSEPIFDHFNLEGDIFRALKRKIWLKSGGYIIIEHTEALTAIDVNTGRYVGKHNLEETILKTNLEAVKEIAYQIRLRDIGGIIIIDFIDMEKKSNQEKVFNALTEGFSKDRSKNHILPMSEMGLIQMTRKRIRKPLMRQLCSPCFYCEGEGHLLSGQTICYNIHREILRNCQDMAEGEVILKVHPQIAEQMLGEENHIICSLEKSLGRQVTIYPEPRFHFEEYDVLETHL